MGEGAGAGTEGLPEPAHEEEELDSHEDRIVQVKLERQFLQYVSNEICLFGFEYMIFIASSKHH